MFGLLLQQCGMWAEKKEQLVTFAGSARYVTNGIPTTLNTVPQHQS